MIVTIDGPKQDTHKPLVNVLSFSGGKQSSALLWMLAKNIIPRPDNLLVLNADPGMENSLTYKYIQDIRDEISKAGIEIITVPGPNLYQDILDLKNTKKIRFDTPSYFVRNKDGIKGKLRQGCTQVYKIYPMDRFVRLWMEEHLGISSKSKRIGKRIVRKWIGFTKDEILRVKPPDQQYVEFYYPLIEMNLSKKDIEEFYVKHNILMPPRSVCNACFANGTQYLRDMYHNRPDDWEQACKVDDAIRDWSQIGVTQPVYVSETLIPLRELPSTDHFQDNVENEYSCDSGFCFL